MEHERFDLLTRALAAPRSRRNILTGLAAGLLASLSLGLDKTEARGRGNRRRRDRRRNRRRRCPDGQVRCGGRCRECCENGHCSSVGPLHVCLNHRCTECLTNGDCDLYLGAKPFCLDQRTCVECLTPTDCPSERPGCIDGRCVQHCNNDLLDGNESDIDCGGRCPKCANGRGCFHDDDCRSGHCDGGTCRECMVDAHCTNPELPACQDGFCWECVSDSHCPDATPWCHSANVCVECLHDSHCPDGQPCQGNRCVDACPERSRNGRARDGDCVDRCANNVQDGDESDIDCGGASCPKCGIGRRCNAASDCATDVCVDRVVGDDLSEPVCVQCTEDAHCTDPARPICSQYWCAPVGGTCAAGQDICTQGSPGGNCGVNCTCRVTREGPTACTKDADAFSCTPCESSAECVARWGPGAVCRVSTGSICTCPSSCGIPC